MYVYLQSEPKANHTNSKTIRSSTIMVLGRDFCKRKIFTPSYQFTATDKTAIATVKRLPTKHWTDSQSRLESIAREQALRKVT
jgi:hypothetical protein